ncbi:hypothetical protein ABT008_22375 [Micromonospora sp. NPDC002389]|uniref:hypothetical protein n=1 Tax=Micromonospora sp. NPDC002389 TaxID=3154272 RepID=UPI00332FE6C2
MWRWRPCAPTGTPLDALFALAGAARLDGELTRSAVQFRMFADVLRDGGYLEAAVDRAAEPALGPALDVRRMLVPVGATAIRRFLRPLAWQNAPEWLLPEELRDGYTEIPRRLDGRLDAGRR